MTKATQKKKKTTTTKKPRAFVLLIVVMLMAVLGVAVAVQLDTARGQSIESSRTRDDAAARAVAETCLDLLLAQTRGYLTSSTPPPPDFDPLLDPRLNDTNNDPDADDFLPPPLAGSDVSNSDVFLPKGSTRLSSHYRLYRFTTQGSACLVRFDDNSDDAVPSPMLPPAATTNNGVIEGPAGDSGRDILNRDRDRAIQLTSIGIFPALANVADDDVFDRAHARVTLRRVVETSGGPAVWAGDRFFTAQDNAVCGLGGVTAEVLNKGSDTLCVCGEQNLNSAPPAPFACDYTSALKPGAMCDDNSRACEPRVLGAVQPQINPYDPSVAVDSPIEELLRDTGGDPDTEVSVSNWRATATVGIPGTNDALEMYVRHKDAIDPLSPTGQKYKDTTFESGVDAEVYGWSTLPSGPLSSIPPLCKNALGATISCLPPQCDTIAGPTMPPPCRYKYTRNPSTGKITNVEPSCLTWPDGTTESMCWVPVARLDGKPGEDLLPGTLVDALLDSPLLAAGRPNWMGLREDTVMEGPVEVLRPRGSGPPLNALVRALMISLGLTAVQTWSEAGGRLVSGVNVPQDWTTTKLLFIDHDSSDDDDDDGHSGGHDNITLHSDWSDFEEFAPKSVFLFENPSNREVIVSAPEFGVRAFNENHPIRTLMMATGDVRFTGKVGICCPSCLCPDSDASTPVPDSMPVQGGSNSDANPRTRPCSGTDGINPLMNPLAPLTNQPIRSRLALRTGGHCSFERDSSVVGDIMCQTVQIKGGGCFVADVFGHGACEDGVCECAGGSCAPGHKKNKLDRGSGDNACGLVTDTSSDGCDRPGVCVGSASSPRTTIIGATFSRGDVCVADPLDTYGQVIAAEDIRFGPEVSVNHDGTTGGGVGAIVSTVAWIEAAR